MSTPVLQILLKTFIFSFAILAGSLQAQIKLEGTVKHNGKPLSGADVLIINSGGDEKELCERVNCQFPR